MPIVDSRSSRIEWALNDRTFLLEFIIWLRRRKMINWRRWHTTKSKQHQESEKSKSTEREVSCLNESVTSQSHACRIQSATALRRETQSKCSTCLFSIIRSEPTPSISPMAAAIMHRQHYLTLCCVQYFLDNSFSPLSCFNNRRIDRRRIFSFPLLSHAHTLRLTSRTLVATHFSIDSRTCGDTKEAWLHQVVVRTAHKKIHSFFIIRYDVGGANSTKFVDLIETLSRRSYSNQKFHFNCPASLCDILIKRLQ